MSFDFKVAKGRSQKLADQYTKNCCDPSPVEYLSRKKNRSYESPNDFRKDNLSFAVFDEIDTPPGNEQPKGRTRRTVGSNEYLSQAVENQSTDHDNGTRRQTSVGKFGRLVVGETIGLSHNTSAPPEAVKAKPLTFTKHNNVGSYKGTRIVPGCTIQQDRQVKDDIEEYSDDNHDTKGPAMERRLNYDRHGSTMDSRSNLKRSHPSDKAYDTPNLHEHYTKRSDDLEKRIHSYHSKSNGQDRKSYGCDPQKFHQTSKARHSDDDTEWMPKDSAEKKSNSRRKSSGLDSKTVSQPKGIRRSPRLPLVGIGNKFGDVIELMDSEDESVRVITASENKRNYEKSPNFRMGEIMKVEAVRIAVGSKVFSSNCLISFQPGGRQQYIYLCYNHGEEKVEHKFFLEDEQSLTDIKYFLADENHASSEDAMSFLAMRITPTESNNLMKYTKSYLSDERLNQSAVQLCKRRYIVIEFRQNDDFKKLLNCMKKNPILDQALLELDDSDVHLYSVTLLEDSRKDKESRNGRFSRSITDNKLLLIYPFQALDEAIEEAAQGLNEASLQIGKEQNILMEVDANDVTDSQEKLVRAHYLTIRDEDRLRLINDEFLNDTLVDFWMQWISRYERKRSSLMHFFTSHFFTTLVNEGPEGVSSWTTKREIKIFEKKFIFIPINERLHWSLCVVVNPGKIRNRFRQDKLDDDQVPCLLFFDSLKAHKKQRIGRNIREWLNFECNRLRYVSDITDSQAPFDEKTMVLYDPKVPYQENSWDCGVFVCRYALGLMQNVEGIFTLQDTKENFETLITDSDHFKFTSGDIYRIRRDMNRLIINLSRIFQSTKAEEEEKLRSSKEQENLQTVLAGDDTTVRGV